MGFSDSYKHLEKLCGEILNDDRRISAYIDEMQNTPRGSFYVRRWDEDLKKLKHYRWIRNQIAHEPGCTEENMCEFGDSAWLDDFYSRIMNGTDPLTLYHKATTTRTTNKSNQMQNPVPPMNPQPAANQNRSSKKTVGCVLAVLIAFLAVAVIYFISNH